MCWWALKHGKAKGSACTVEGQTLILVAGAGNWACWGTPFQPNTKTTFQEDKLSTPTQCSVILETFNPFKEYLGHSFPLIVLRLKFYERKGSLDLSFSFFFFFFFLFFQWCDVCNLNKTFNIFSPLPTFDCLRI